MSSITLHTEARDNGSRRSAYPSNQHLSGIMMETAMIMTGIFLSSVLALPTKTDVLDIADAELGNLMDSRLVEWPTNAFGYRARRSVDVEINGDRMRRLVIPLEGMANRQSLF
jgi:hypothetical protein